MNLCLGYCVVLYCIVLYWDLMYVSLRRDGWIVCVGETECKERLRWGWIDIAMRRCV